MKLFFLFTALIAISIEMQSQTIYSLADCRKMAASNNKDLLIATEKAKAAGNLKKAAHTQYLPNFSANGTYIRNQKNVSMLGEDQYLPVYTTTNGAPDITKSIKGTVSNGTFIPLDANNTPFDPRANPEKIQWNNLAYMPKDAFEFNTQNIFAGAITMTQPLFMGGKIRELNRIAESGKDLAEAQLEGETTETIINTDVAYWRIISLANKEKLAKSYVALLMKLEKDMEKAIAFGVATKSDGLTVNVKLNEAEMSLLQVQDGLSLSRMALCQQCGLPMNAEFKLADEELKPMSDIQVEAIPKEVAINNRYEVKSLEQLANIAESNKKIMVSRFLPNAGLTAGYLTSNPNVFNGYQQEFGGQWQIGVVVNVPLFHWGERVHTLRAAENERNIAQYKLEDAKEKIELDITQAGFKMAEANKKAKMTISNKDKAEENLKYATVGQESGVISSAALMEAQTAWLKAHSENIDAQIDLQMCKVYLQKALGNLK
ncbi:MAG: TolC family protein [Bacteroidales bacterium]|nr:TolC family protein [Bacteroidales bacterium]